MKHTGTILLCLLAMLPIRCRKSAPSTATVTIRSQTWRVEVAITAPQRYAGLSGRANLAEGQGLLFVYPAPRVLEFCMRGCDRPLDVAFLESDLRVVKIHTMAVEPGLAGRATYSSETPAQYALEVRGEALQRAGVQPGDQVFLSGDIPQATKAEDGP